MTCLIVLHKLFVKANRFPLENFEQIYVQSGDFLLMDHQDLEQVLAEDCLNVHKEYIAFKVLIDWISHEMAHRCPLLKNMSSKIRLGLLSDEELNEAENMDLVKNDASAQKLIAETRATVSAVKRKYDYALQSTTVRARYPNEVLLITGGQNNYILDTFESYDTRTDQCRICHQHLLLRCYHGSCCLEGHVFLIGGENGSGKLSTGHQTLRLHP